MDLYAHSEQPAEKLFSFEFQQVGQHRLRLLNAGEKNPAASDIILRSDGFDYTY